MKKTLFLAIMFAILLNSMQIFAQTDETKNKVVMTVIDSGKPIITELNSVNLSVNRYEGDTEEPEEAKNPGKDTTKVKLANKILKPANGVSYLTMEAKTLSPEMLKVIAKSKATFDGSIVISDAATKKTLKTLKFSRGTLYSYSDQFSAVGYSDSFGSSVLSIYCRELTVDGVIFQ